MVSFTTVLNFSTPMYAPPLGMPWSKEQVEIRLSQVRSQNSSLIPDRQGVSPGGGAGEGLCTRACVCVCGYLKEFGPPPTEP